MKSAISTTALSSLLFSLVAMTSMQAFSESLPAAGQQPFLMLAEGGGDRLIQYREAQAQRRQTTADDSERFVQLVEEQPTAAGAAKQAKDVGAMPQTRYQSRIHHRNLKYDQ
ncbi:hypothetical protein [Pseudomonas sp. Q1-7]|uniref:hypothetical protein n=1 Tax=Pseudomonas sp. Q1-7 TaxID=3020843 RepID=UPI002300DCE0|nr:hypothetical protein [Pseudomonas sp. Q1-7]